MQCGRLINLAKTWYVSVKEETMAPARMVQFIKQHVAGCSVCQEDPDLQEEIVKITEIVLPESKIPKAIRLKQEQDEIDYDDDEEEDDSGDDTDDSEEFEDVEETDEEDTFVDDDESDEEPLAPDDEEF